MPMILSEVYYRIMKEKKQYIRILDGFVTTVVVLTAATLIASGIAISKVNSEYMATGIKAAKIVAERENQEIAISLDDKLLVAPKSNFSAVDEVLSLLPPPINTGYMIFKEINSAVFEK